MKSKKNILIKFNNLSTFVKNTNIIYSITSNIYKNKINTFLGISGVGKSSLYKSFLREDNFVSKGEII